MDHCIATIRRIIAQDLSDRRSILQLGYNLGRLSELTKLGRGPFWDRWKEAVARWDREALEMLAQELLDLQDIPAADPDRDPPEPRDDAPHWRLRGD